MNDARLMIQYIEEQNMEKASSQFQKVLAHGEDEEQYALAEELSAYGFLDETRKLYESLIGRHPEEAELKLLLAEVLIDLDDEESAFPLLETIEPDDPNYPAALLIQADLYQMQGLFEVSEQKLLAAKKAAGDEPVIEYALGELLMSQGRFLESARYFQRLLEAGETEIAGVSLNSRMAEALSAGGAFEDSLPFYEKAVEEHPDINDLFGYALTLYQTGQYERAIGQFEELKAMDPDYHALYLYLAKCHEHLEEVGEALKSAREGIELDGFNKELLFYAGKLSLKAGDPETAEEYFREALVLDPEYIEAALTLNSLLLHQEKYEELADTAAELKLGDLGEPQFHWDEAYSLQKLDRFEEASKGYELAYTAFKDHRDFLKDFGYFLLEDGQRKRAHEIFVRLAEIEPYNEEWALLLERLEEVE